MNIYPEILDADKRIRKYVPKSELMFSEYFRRKCGCNVHFKLDSELPTGSFKIRGVMNKLLKMSAAERKKGVVAYSTGNHAKAIAHACKLLDIPGKVFVPYSSQKKVKDLKSSVEIMTYERSDDEPEITAFARNLCSAQGLTFVSPYNDYDIVAGQGTCGAEIFEQLPDVDAVFVCVGGAGLISGIGTYLKENTSVQMIGCSPKNSAPMYHSVQKGKVVMVENKETLSDGSAGNNELDTITFDLCKNLVDDWDLVSETEIKDAMKDFMEQYPQHIIEGAAAVPLATLMKKKHNVKNAVVVLCGSNIGKEQLRSAMR